MSRIIETEVFTYEELDDRAKEKARDWYRKGVFDYDWWDCLYDDAAEIADLLGIDLRQKRVTLMNGGHRYDPAIYFTGFYHQGSGSSFEGSYSYRKGALQAIQAYAPKDNALHQIARDLQEVQRKNFYALTAKVKSHRDHSIDVEVYKDGDTWSVTREAEEGIKEALNDFNHWIFRRLQDEYEYLTSDEVVEQSIIANEYEFESDGSRI